MSAARRAKAGSALARFELLSIKLRKLEERRAQVVAEIAALKPELEGVLRGAGIEVV